MKQRHVRTFLKHSETVDRLFWNVYDTLQQSRLLHYHPKLNWKHVNFFFMYHDKVLFKAMYNPTREKAVQHSDYGGCKNTWQSTNIINRVLIYVPFSPRNTKKIERHAEKLSTPLSEATLRENTDNYLAIAFSLSLPCWIRRKWNKATEHGFVLTFSMFNRSNITYFDAQ